MRRPCGQSVSISWRYDPYNRPDSSSRITASSQRPAIPSFVYDELGPSGFVCHRIVDAPAEGAPRLSSPRIENVKALAVPERRAVGIGRIRELKGRRRRERDGDQVRRANRRLLCPEQTRARQAAAMTTGAIDLACERHKNRLDRLPGREFNKKPAALPQMFLTSA